MWFKKKLDYQPLNEHLKCEIKTKYHIVESQSTQVRQRYLKCDTQLLYGASGPSVKMAVVGQVTHVRCKIMYRCVCARHCAVETDTQQGYRQRAENKQTNLGSYSIPTELMSLSHDDSHAITPDLGNKVICDWHTSNVHNTFRVETRDV